MTSVQEARARLRDAHGWLPCQPCRGIGATGGAGWYLDWDECDACMGVGLVEPVNA
jgi:hypothetical protein